MTGFARLTTFSLWRTNHAYSWLDLVWFDCRCHCSGADAGSAADGNHHDNHLGRRRLVCGRDNCEPVARPAYHRAHAGRLDWFDSRRHSGADHLWIVAWEANDGLTEPPSLTGVSKSGRSISRRSAEIAEQFGRMCEHDRPEVFPRLR